MSIFRSTEEFLLRRCRAGDETAWNRIVDLYQRLVYSIPRRAGLSEDDAADVFQATFIALFDSLSRIENAETLPRWVAVVATRETWKMVQRRNQVAAVESDILDALLTPDGSAVEDDALKSMRSVGIRGALAEVPEPCRTLLTKLYIDESTYEAVSQELGMAMGSIGPTRARCLARLKKLLETKGVLSDLDVSS